MDQNMDGSKLLVEEHHDNDKETKETIDLIHGLQKQVDVLVEQQLKLVPLTPFGILVKFLCEKSKVTYNELMYDTMEKVWNSLGQDTRMRLYGASMKDHVSVEKQRSVIDNEILQLRCEIARSSLKLRSSPKDSTSAAAV
ncbi:hypothetical protein GHT06_021070 [Daphnia sinensis]|uniref:Uncharacterized protein n=1 Tax=Daphnia sinensis TaxID=1820382 RepID=A0AAD5KIM7_9CRUS|nr:hypothetical protein GHT06_021070 [Daphnia sinensis]